MTVGGVGGLIGKTNKTSSANIESESRCKTLGYLTGQSTHQFSFQSILSSSMKQHFNNPHQKRLTEMLGFLWFLFYGNSKKARWKPQEKQDLNAFAVVSGPKFIRSTIIEKRFRICSRWEHPEPLMRLIFDLAIHRFFRSILGIFHLSLPFVSPGKSSTTWGQAQIVSECSLKRLQSSACLEAAEKPTINCRKRVIIPVNNCCRVVSTAGSAGKF